MKGPAGYGRYDDDPGCVGCPFAKSDMSPCIARDGRLALAGLPGSRRDCVGCGHVTTFLLHDLATEYAPARAPREIPEGDAEGWADEFCRFVREATEPSAAGTTQPVPSAP